MLKHSEKNKTKHSKAKKEIKNGLIHVSSHIAKNTTENRMTLKENQI